VVFQDNTAIGVNTGGGGLQNEGGGATVTNCTFQDNQATNADRSVGGGIFNHYGTITVTNTTFLRNSAIYGGGIALEGGDTVSALTNCTLSGNSSANGSAVLNFSTGGIPTVNLDHCTLYQNTGVAIENWNELGYGAVLTLHNTILAQNLGGNLRNVGAATTTSLGYNLSDQSEGAFLNQPTDLLKTDPLLAGGFGTFVPRPGSPARDTADPGDEAVTTDQRGVPRPQGAGPDIGAIEARPYAVEVSNGNFQSVPVTGDFAALQVQVTEGGQGILGVPVTFTVLNFQPGDPSFGGSASVTVYSGFFGLTSAHLKAGTVAGSFIVKADIGDTSTYFYEWVAPGPLDHFDVVGPSTAVPGVPFQVTISPRDRFDNLIFTYTGQVVFSSTDSRAQLPPPFTFSGDSGMSGSESVPVSNPGEATVMVVLGTTGPQTLTVADNSGVKGALAVSVANEAPANLALTVPAQPIPEGGSVTLGGSFSDPADDGSHTVRVDWGDGTPVSVIVLGGDVTSFNLSHTYTGTAPGQAVAPFPVTATVTDASGASVSATATVQVANVAPVTTAGGDQFIDAGDLFVRTGSFVDPGANQFTATVDYGDGTGPQSLALNADKTFVLEHVFGREGSFLVTVAVSDDRGGVGITTFFADVLLPGVPVVLAEKGVVARGSTMTVQTLGVTATVTHEDGAPFAALIVAVVPPPVAEALTAGENVQVVGAYDLRSINLTDADTATITFTYFGDLTAPPTLTFLDEAGNPHPVVPSQLAPGALRVDLKAHTVTVILDRSSLPALDTLGRTVFTLAAPRVIEGGGTGASLAVALALTVTAQDAIGVVTAAEGGASGQGGPSSGAVTGSALASAGALGTVGGGNESSTEGDALGVLSYLPPTDTSLITLPVLSVSPARPAAPAQDFSLPVAPPVTPASKADNEAAASAPSSAGGGATGAALPHPAAGTAPSSSPAPAPAVEPGGLEGHALPAEESVEESADVQAPPALGWSPALLAGVWLLDRRRARKGARCNEE
jgi:hypothetical protein